MKTKMPSEPRCQKCSLVILIVGVFSFWLVGINSFIFSRSLTILLSTFITSCTSRTVLLVLSLSITCFIICRAVNLYPHRFVGVVGRHGAFGIEAIDVSCDQKYLASCCQDDVIKFWDLQHVYKTETDERKKVR